MKGKGFKKHLQIINIVLLCALFVISCSNEPLNNNNNQPEQQPQAIALKYTREFWGEWKKMDQSETWLISSTSIKVNGVELSKVVILAKPSQNVISVTDNGNTYCLYAIRTASSSITGSVLTEDTSRDITAGWLSVVVQNINDIYDVVETTTDENGNFEAENLISGEDYNIKIGDTSLNVRPSFDGEDIGNITLKSGVNFKVTLSNANDLLYAGSQYYSMNLIIENIGDTNCTAATYSLVGDEGIEVINNYDDGVLLRTVAAGEKKVIPLRVRCDIPESETAVKKLNLAITDKDGTVWNDSVSLKFYRDNVTINVVSENGRPISGVIIGDGRTYSITNSTDYSIQIPVTAESYLLVFSGAIANATRNTEAAYSVGVNKPAIAASDLLAELGTGTNSYEPNDDENHARSVTFGKAIVSYLFENDIDYYYLEPLHLWDEGVVTKPATCTEDGSITYTCKVCGDTTEGIIPATGHSFSSEWLKDADYHWHAAICGHDVISEKLKHTWDEGTVLVEPTQTKEGQKLLTCTACGQTKTESIPMVSYSIGDIGPAGGFIFYDCDADNDSGNADGLKSTECGWRYLEAAPADLRVVNGTPTIDSSLYGYSIAPARYRFGWYRIEDGIGLYVNGTTEYSPLNCTREEIGTGERNTRLLVLAMGDEPYSSESGSEKLAYYPAKLCYDLVHTVNGVSYSNWFLPSKDELNLMYENLRLAGLGNFVNYGTYYENWSSSEFDEGGAFYQNFDEGGQYGGNRADDYDQIRPVRAFSQNEQQGHVYQIEILNEPSCTNGGLVSYTCKNCGRSFEEIIPAFGHSFSSEWSKDEDYHWHAASCGHEVTSEKDNHSWDAGVVTKEPSCSEDGIKTYVCTECGQNKIEVLPSTHQFSEEWSFDADYHWHEATCGHDVESGKTSHTFDSNHICSVCGFVTNSYMLKTVVYSKANGYNIEEGKEYVGVYLDGQYKDSISSVVFIPSRINGYDVKSIESNAFENCDCIERIVLPASIEYILSDAFKGCSNLTSINIPESVVYIGQWAFWGTGLTTIKLPDSVIDIQRGAFGIPSLEVIQLSNSTYSIGEEAFGGCQSLKTIDLPETVFRLERMAFVGSGLINITIPNGVTTLEEYLFYGCSDLESVSIPSSVVSIGERVFLYCSSLSDISFDGTIEQWNSIEKDSAWNEGINYLAIIHCSDGDLQAKTYQIGEVGPAGGFIFYDCDADNEIGNEDGLISSETGWRYLEAAPADLRVVNGIPTVDSSINGYSDAPVGYVFGLTKDNYLSNATEYGVSYFTDIGIGTGENNTQLLVTAIGNEAYRSNGTMTENYAARLCNLLTYTVGGEPYNDWFLPSKDELNLMYTSLIYAVASFGYSEYWSSSEGSVIGTAWAQYNYVDFPQSQYGCDNPFRIRPIRAF